MTIPVASPTMMVSLREASVAQLLSLRESRDESVNDIIDRLARASFPIEPALLTHHERVSEEITSARYSCEVLGKRLNSETLPCIYTEVIDVMQDVAPDVLLRLAALRARERRFISRTKTDIHPGRPDLAVIQARSGWWVSGNVGLRDVVRGLKALCLVASIEYGKDVKFSAARAG